MPKKHSDYQRHRLFSSVIDVLNGYFTRFLLHSCTHSYNYESKTTTRGSGLTIRGNIGFSVQSECTSVCGQEEAYIKTLVDDLLCLLSDSHPIIIII